MAGLLDSKTRVMDAKLTARGKASLVAGGLEVKYISFSDLGVTYENDGRGVAVEPLPLGLEVFSTSNDDITVTTDDFGDLNSFSGNGYFVRQDGTAALSDSAVKDLIFSGSLESFENQRLLSTRSPLLEDPGLSISPKSVSFSVSDDSPFGDEPSESSTDDIESLFADKRLSRSIRFQYLPPVQRTITTVGNESVLGSYVDVREAGVTEQDLESTIASLQSQKLSTSKLTDRNEVCLQLFESSSSGLTKLDIIRYGDLQQRGSSGKQRTLYFAGKVYEDGYGIPTFVNLFDLVIE